MKRTTTGIRLRSALLRPRNTLLAAIVAGGTLLAAPTIALQSQDRDDDTQRTRQRMTDRDRNQESGSWDFWDYWGSSESYTRDVDRDNWWEFWEHDAEAAEEYDRRVRTDAEGNVFYWQDGEWQRADVTLASSRQRMDDRRQRERIRDIDAHDADWSDSEGYLTAYTYPYYYEYGLLNEEPIIPGTSYYETETFYEDFDYTPDRKRTQRLQDSSISGEIDGFRHIDVQTDQGAQKHTLVRMRFEDGSSSIVALGPKADLDALGLKSGQKVEIKGEYGAVAGRQALIAETIKVNDKTIRLDERFATSQPYGREFNWGDQFSDQNLGQQRTAEGTVKEVQNVTLTDRSGQAADHVIVLMVVDGRDRPVDLGPANQRGVADLRTGERLSVTGREGSIDDRAAIYADEITRDGRAYTVERSGMRDERFAQSGQRDLQTLRGTVEDVHAVNMYGANDPYTLVKIRTEDGRSVVVSFGPERDVENLKDKLEGSDIVIRGQNDVVNGRPVLVANRVSVDGETMNVSQPHYRQMNREGRDRSQMQSEQSGTAVGMKTIEVTAVNMRFNPSEIVAQPGQKVRITLQNNGDAEHSIEFHLPDGEKALDAHVQPGSSRVIEFTAPQQPGEYEFYCPISNHRERGMTGKLIVKNTTTGNSGG